ncbi:hypothetical protein LCGC14_2219140 [marine sediment metagenome]|uniref:Uncharacterized protein n=1 Tax=marine sediment metagenome TaxID=412755 RepID=A0A0F9DBH3_9ZZZZ
MGEPLTTHWHNVKGRAEFLQLVDERKNCEDIKGEILNEAERYAYALCEELDRMEQGIMKLTGLTTGGCRTGKSTKGVET